MRFEVQTTDCSASLIAYGDELPTGRAVTLRVPKARNGWGNLKLAPRTEMNGPAWARVLRTAGKDYMRLNHEAAWHRGAGAHNLMYLHALCSELNKQGET